MSPLIWVAAYAGLGASLLVQHHRSRAPFRRGRAGWDENPHEADGYLVRQVCVTVGKAAIILPLGILFCVGGGMADMVIALARLYDRTLGD